MQDRHFKDQQMPLQM